MSVKVSCGQFDYVGDSATLGSRWELWLQRFKLYVTANGLKDAAIIKASFLLLMGQEAFNVYQSKRTVKMVEGVEVEDTLAEVQALMTTHFVPKRSEYSEVCTFRRAMRYEGERVSDYALRLRALSTHCKFGTALEKEIERQFVVGCNIKDVQWKCCRTDDLDLAKAIEIALGYERVAASVNGLQNPTEAELARSDINKIGGQDKNEDEDDARDHSASRESNSSGKSENPVCRRDRCGYCGRQSHSDMSKCPAKGTKCSNCGGLHHYASECWSKNGRATFRTNQRDNSDDWRAGRGKVENQCRDQRRSDQQTRVNHMELGADVHQVSSEEYAEFMRYKEACNYGLYAINTSEERADDSRLQRPGIRTNRGPRADLSINADLCTFLIDTASPINVVNERVFNSWSVKPTLEPCRTRFYGYNWDAPLPVLGEFTAEIGFRDQLEAAKFILIRGEAESLISFDTARRLGVILIDESAKYEVANHRRKTALTDATGDTHEPNSAIRERAAQERGEKEAKRRKIPQEASKSDTNARFGDQASTGGQTARKSTFEGDDPGIKWPRRTSKSSTDTCTPSASIVSDRAPNNAAARPERKNPVFHLKERGKRLRQKVKFRSKRARDFWTHANEQAQAQPSKSPGELSNHPENKAPRKRGVDVISKLSLENKRLSRQSDHMIA